MPIEASFGHFEYLIRIEFGREGGYSFQSPYRPDLLVRRDKIPHKGAACDTDNVFLVLVINGNYSCFFIGS